MAATAIKPSKAEISLSESVFSPGAKPNRDSGVIPGVKIVGFDSKNKRRYLPETLRRAVPLYEGAPVYINHPPKGGSDRPYQDHFGTMQNVRMSESGLIGDLKYKKKHLMAEMVLEDAEDETKGVGLSPNHFGDGPVKNGIRIVENITRVASVDIVADPATNRSFRESSENQDVELQEQLTEANGRVAELTKENARLSGEVASLKESVEKFDAAQKKADHKAAVVKMLDEAKVPEAKRTKHVMHYLESLSADDAAKEVKEIAEQKSGGSSAKSVPGTPRQLNEGTGATTSTVTDGKSFASLIHS